MVEKLEAPLPALVEVARSYRAVAGHRWERLLGVMGRLAELERTAD